MIERQVGLRRGDVDDIITTTEGWMEYDDYLAGGSFWWSKNDPDGDGTAQPLASSYAVEFAVDENFTIQTEDDGSGVLLLKEDIPTTGVIRVLPLYYYYADPGLLPE